MTCRSGLRRPRPCRPGSSPPRRGWPRCVVDRRASAPSSETTPGPGVGDRFGVPSPASTPSSTCRAILSLSRPESTSAVELSHLRRGDRRVLQRDALALARRASSPVHHLRAAAGVAPAATVCLDELDGAGVDHVAHLEVGETPVGLEAPAPLRAARAASPQLLDPARGSGRPARGPARGSSGSPRRPTSRGRTVVTPVSSCQCRVSWTIVAALVEIAACRVIS